MSVDKDRKTKLTGQDNRPFLAGIQQDRCAVAAVIHFTILSLPLSVAAAQVKGIFGERIPVVGQDFAVLNAYFCTF